MAARGPGLYTISLLAGAYFAAGKLSLLLAAPPGYTAPVWPAAGIALAAVLLFGRGAWPGIFLGSFCVNFPAGLDPATGGTLLKAVGLAATIAAGATLASLFTETLVRRTVSDVFSLSSEREVGRFVLAAGPLGTVVGATVGVTALHHAGLLAAPSVPFTWATWWVGDAIGTILFTPLILAWARPSAAMSPSRRLAVTVPIVVALGMAVALFLYAEESEERRIAGEFQERTNDLVQTFRASVDGYLVLLSATERLFSSSESVHAAEFRRFVSTLIPRQPGVQAMSWTPRVAGRDRRAFEQARRKEGDADFAIRESVGPRELRPAGERAEHFPVAYAEPPAAALTLGLDQGADPIRREALFRARDGGEPAASAPMRLPHGPSTPTGFLIFQPVYEPGRPLDSEAERRRAFVGAVSVVFNASDLVHGALRGVRHDGIRVSLSDFGTAGRRALYRYPAGSPPDDLLLPVASGFLREVVLEVAGRRWLLSFSATEEYLAANRSLQAWSLLATGLLFTALFAAFLLVLTGRTAIIEGLVRERTAALEDEIAERRRNEDALRTSEERFRSLSVASPIGIFQTDAEGRFRYVNPRWQEITGLAPEQAYGEGWLRAVHPEDREAVEREWRSAVGEARDFAREFRLETPSGARWALCRAAAVRSPADGPVDGFVGTCEDITSRKSAEQSIRESEERYRMLAEQSTDFISRHRLDGRTIYASPACRTILGYDPEDLVGRSSYELFHPADVEPFRRRIAAASARNEVVTVSYRMRRKDGEYAWVESSIRVLADPAGGTPSEIVAVSRDVSERKRVERMRQDMVAMLSHDIKNPLAAVLGFAEILRELPIDDARRREFLARIEANAHTALSLAINFVDVTQIESGAIEPRLETVSLNEMVEHVLGHQEARARVKEIRLDTSLDPAAPAALVDRRLTDRVLANLVNNAIKFSPPKTRVVVETSVADGRATVRVRDQGPGIAVEDRAKLFQRFSQVGNRRGDSSGLGLFIVKTLVDAQGGTVGAQFPAEGGSVFEVSFPASAAPAMPVRAAQGR